jgi:hypothetical protein
MPLTEKYFDAIITGKYQVNTDFMNEMDCIELSKATQPEPDALHDKYSMLFGKQCHNVWSKAYPSR